MATSPPFKVRGPSAFGRRRRNRPQLSQKDADELREHELDTIPRNGSLKVETIDEFLDRLDSAVLVVAQLRERYMNEGQRDWWHMADLLDDVADLRCALQGDVRGCEVYKPAAVKLVFLVEPGLPELPTQAQLVAAAQGLASMRWVYRPGTKVYTPEERIARAKVYKELRLEALQNVQLCAAPQIASAALFKERLFGAVRTVADLRERYKVNQRSDWWHMDYLLDDLVDLMDAIRPRPHNRALFDAVDLIVP